MKKFINYKNGWATINTYRFPDAEETDVADVLNGVKINSKRIMTASIEDETLDIVADCLGSDC